MARLAGRRTRTPESDDDDEESRPQTPLSTALNDRKRARPNIEESDDADSGDSQQRKPLPQQSVSEEKPTILNGQVLSGHKPGSIVRVKLINFVTYTSAEFYLGPNLNMIIGPNGTGKSTLVCAICLGLGWATHYLGRAKDAAEFIKHGCREATIEIELQRKESGPGATRRNPVITRTIKRDGSKSKFLLNGKDNTQKGVQSLCKETYNIQIDNLCQFLPQDKVVEFAQMNPIQILESTQNAAGTPEMVQHHEALKTFRSAQKALLQDNRGGREQLENLERRQEMQRTDAERMRERARTKKKLEWLEQCGSIPKYATAKKERQEARNRQQELSVELEKLTAELEPTLRKVNAKQAYKTRIEVVVKDMQRAVTVVEKKADAKEKTIKDLATKAADLQRNKEAEKRDFGPKKEQRLKLTQNITQLKRQQSEKSPDFDPRAMNQEIRDRRLEVRNLEDQQAESASRQKELGEQGRSRQDEIKRFNQRLANLQTQSGQQESKLQAASHDTSEAWAWIQKNQSLFEKHVYGPPLVECTLIDPKLARQIESLMQPSDFKIITAQTDKDFRLLQQKLSREMGLIDIVLRTCSETDLSQFRRPIPDEELAERGLDSYLIDHVQGPATVLAMLCVERFLHQSAFAAQKLSNEQHEVLQNSELSNYISGDLIFQFTRRGVYGKQGNMTRTRAVKNAGEFWTAQSVDMGRKAATERELAEKTGEVQMIKEEYEKCKKEVIELKAKMQELEQEIKDIEQNKAQKQLLLTQWNALPAKIRQNEEKVEGIDEWLTGVRRRMNEIDDKIAQSELERAEIVCQHAACLTEVREAQQTCLEAEILLIQAVSDFETLRDLNQAVRASLDQKRKEEKQAREKAEEATKTAKELVNQVKKTHAAAQQLDHEGEPGFLELLRDMGGGPDEPHWTTERLDAEIDSQKAQLELTDGGSMHVIKEFEDRARAIEKLQARLADFNQKQEDQANAIKEVRGHWELQLEALVGKISDAFADSFARIGCAGQVAVHKASSEDPVDCTEANGGAENGLDFANWAIHISVKFRENEPLSLLDSHRQSGGERAVSTIFYLMALQSLSRAPFRVVDEINQGMDPRNERMVHGRMVDIATDDGGSQYFLITPKLLSGLKYRRGMTISCIISGENVPGEGATYQDDEYQVHAAPTMDFSGFARKARQKGMATNFGPPGADGGRRVDSGVDLGSSFGSVEVGA